MNVTFLKNKPDEASISSKNRWVNICKRLLCSDNEAVKIEFETSKKAGGRVSLGAELHRNTRISAPT